MVGAVIVMLWPLPSSDKYWKVQDPRSSFAMMHFVILFQDNVPDTGYFLPHCGMAESQPLAHLPDGKAVGINKYQGLVYPGQLVINYVLQ